MRRPLKTIAALLKALLLVGCNLTGLRDSVPPTPTTPPLPTATQTDAPVLQPTPIPFNPNEAWQLVAPGLERRYYQPDGLGPLATIVVHRIDPAQFAFRAHISTSRPLYNTTWRDALRGATGFINANFFDTQNAALGLVVADGMVYGSSFVGRGGMFAVQNGVPRVQSLIQQPYDGAALEQAVQGFPMLVLDGVPNFQQAPGDRQTRRTVVAIDTQGRVLWISTPLLGTTLDEMATFLFTSDLGIVNALNLDGGGSMLLEMPGASLPSLDPVPVVLAVYPK